MKKLPVKIIVPLILVGIIFCGYFRLLSPDFSLRWDIYNVHYSSLKFLSDSFREQGELPLWNPSQFGGYPVYADPQPALFYPPHFFLVIAGAVNPITIKLLLFAHFLLAGLGMYMLARRFFERRTTAFVLGLTYAFSGFFVGHATHLGIVEAYSWLPWIIWLLEKSWKNHFLSYGLLAALVGSFVVVIGHAQSTLAIFSFLLVYIIQLGWRYRRQNQRKSLARTISLIAIFFGFALGLSALQIIPTKNFAAQTVRSDVSLTTVQTEFLDPRGWLTLLFPNLFDSVLYKSYWGPTDVTQHYLYIGVIPVLLLIIILKRRGEESTAQPAPIFLGIAALIAFLYSSGPLAPIQTLFYFFVPFFDKFRAAANTAEIFLFLLILLGGYGWSQIQSLTESDKKKWLAVAAKIRKPAIITTTLIILNVVLFMLFLYLTQEHNFINLYFSGNLFASIVYFFTVTWLTWLITNKFLRGSLKSSRFSQFLILLTILDLLTFTTNSQLVAVDKKITDSERTNPIQEFFITKTDHLQEPYRVFSDSWGSFLPRHDIFLFSGYNPLVLNNYALYVEAAHITDGYFTRVLNDFSVRYAFVRDQKPYPALTSWTVAEDHGILANPHPASYVTFPRQLQTFTTDATSIEQRQQVLSHHAEDMAWIGQSADIDPQTYEDGATHYQVKTYSPNKIELNISTEKPQAALIKEIFYPGWSALIDGEPAPVHQMNILFRGLYIPAGDHKVVLTFSPPDRKLGQNISLLSGVLWSTMLLISLLVSGKNRPPINLLK